MQSKASPNAIASTSPNGLYGMPGHLIRRCHQISVALFHEECAAFEITPPQYAALRTLADHNGVDQIQLAGLVAFNRTTVGEVVDRLESDGMLRREENSQDRRKKNLFITPTGRRLIASVDAAVNRVQQRLIAPLNPKEQSQLMALLARIASANNEYSRAPLRPPRQRAGSTGARPARGRSVQGDVGH